MSEASQGSMPGVESDALDISIMMLGNELRAKNRTILLGGLIIVLLLILMGYFATHQPPEHVVSMDSQGRMRPLPTLSNPVIPQSEWVKWAEEHAEALFDIPYTELPVYQNKLTFMTLDSRKNWLEALRSAGYLKKIGDERSILRAIKLNRASLHNEWELPGDKRLVRQFIVPLQLIFESAKGKEYDEVVLTLNVAREHLSVREDGLILGTVSVARGRVSK